MTIGTKIRKLRDLQDLTQDYVAAKLGISQNAFSKIERGETDLTYSTLSRIALILKVDVSRLVDFDERQMLSNITDNKDQNTNRFIVPTSKIEKELYDKVIEQLQNENSYLKKLLDSYIR